MVTITDIYRLLPTPPPSSFGGVRFAVQSLEGYEAYRIAKDDAAKPALLISTPTTGSHSLVDYSLENLDVLHGVICEITSPEGVRKRNKFSLIRCTSDDTTVQEHFLESLGSIIAAIGMLPTASDISLGVGKLVELFRLMQRHARKSVQGLWAELLVIVESTDPESLGRAWHGSFMDTYDFNAGHQRVEVKSALGHQRLHHFALEQVSPPPGIEVVIVSLLLQRAAAGPSVVDLANEVRGRLSSSPELLVQFDKIVAECLGDQWRAASQMHFDRHSARQSLAIYRGADIPKVDPMLPPNVTDVHFQAELSEVAPVLNSAMMQAGGLFAAVLLGD